MIAPVIPENVWIASEFYKWVYQIITDDPELTKMSLTSTAHANRAKDSVLGIITHSYLPAGNA